DRRRRIQGRQIAFFNSGHKTSLTCGELPREGMEDVRRDDDSRCPGTPVTLSSRSRTISFRKFLDKEYRLGNSEQTHFSFLGALHRGATQSGIRRPFWILCQCRHEKSSNWAVR